MRMTLYCPGANSADVDSGVAFALQAKTAALGLELGGAELKLEDVVASLVGKSDPFSPAYVDADAAFPVPDFTSLDIAGMLVGTAKASASAGDTASIEGELGFVVSFVKPATGADVEVEYNYTALVRISVKTARRLTRARMSKCPP